MSDNGVGMSRDDLTEALGTIARSGTRAFLEQLGDKGDGSRLIGQFGVGFYSAFMVAGRVDVLTRKAGESEAWLWSSDGQGSYTIEPAGRGCARARNAGGAPPQRGQRGLRAGTHDRAHRARARQRGPGADRPRGEAEGGEAEDATTRRIGDGAAIWAKPKSEITPEDYTNFYQSVSGQFDDPALTIHWRAEGRHEYSVLAFVPSTPPLRSSTRCARGA